MNYKFFVLIFFLLFSCTTNQVDKKIIVQSEIYSNKGFTLLYNEKLRKQKLLTNKIEERSLIIFQKNLKKGTTVKITNLLNNKSILAKVGSKSKYPFFYNSVISKRIFEVLELNDSEPYVEIKTVSENSIFLAKSPYSVKASSLDPTVSVSYNKPIPAADVPLSVKGLKVS